MGFQQATVLLIQISISLSLSLPFCSLTTHPQLGEDNKSLAKAMTLKGFVWNASKSTTKCSDAPGDNISQRQLLVRLVSTNLVN